MKKKLRVGVMIVFMIVLSIQFFMDFLYMANLRYVTFCSRRHDIAEAGMKVDSEEKNLIEKQIKKIQVESVKKILTPIVVADSK